MKRLKKSISSLNLRAFSASCLPKGIPGRRKWRRNETKNRQVSNLDGDMSAGDTFNLMSYYIQRQLNAHYMQQDDFIRLLNQLSTVEDKIKALEEEIVAMRGGSINIFTVQDKNRRGSEKRRSGQQHSKRKTKNGICLCLPDFLSCKPTLCDSFETLNSSRSNVNNGRGTADVKSTKTDVKVHPESTTHQKVSWVDGVTVQYIDTQIESNKNFVAKTAKNIDAPKVWDNVEASTDKIDKNVVHIKIRIPKKEAEANHVIEISSHEVIPNNRMGITGKKATNWEIGKNIVNEESPNHVATCGKHVESIEYKNQLIAAKQSLIEHYSSDGITVGNSLEDRKISTIQRFQQPLDKCYLTKRSYPIQKSTIAIDNVHDIDLSKNVDRQSSPSIQNNATSNLPDIMDIETHDVDCYCQICRTFGDVELMQSVSRNLTDVVSQKIVRVPYNNVFRNIICHANECRCEICLTVDKQQKAIYAKGDLFNPCHYSAASIPSAQSFPQENTSSEHNENLCSRSPPIYLSKKKSFVSHVANTQYRDVHNKECSQIIPDDCKLTNNDSCSLSHLRYEVINLNGQSPIGNIPENHVLHSKMKGQKKSNIIYSQKTLEETIKDLINTTTIEKRKSTEKHVQDYVLSLGEINNKPYTKIKIIDCPISNSARKNSELSEPTLCQKSITADSNTFFFKPLSHLTFTNKGLNANYCSKESQSRILSPMNKYRCAQVRRVASSLLLTTCNKKIHSLTIPNSEDEYGDKTYSKKNNQSPFTRRRKYKRFGKFNIRVTGKVLSLFKKTAQRNTAMLPY